MSKFLGKLTSSSRVLPTVNDASGIWNTSEQIQSQKASNWPIAVFKNIVLPEILGTATIGYSSLFCTTGDWSFSRNITFTYQWYRNNVAITGATSSSYTLILIDGNSSLKCIVIATYTITNTSVTASSLPTTAVVIPVVNQVEFTTPGTYQWTAPEGVESVSVVCIGGGGAGAYLWDKDGTNLKGHINLHGGGAGGLGWKNNIPVVAGTSYTVVVGSGATRAQKSTWPTFVYAGDSYFINSTTVLGGGGASGYSTTGYGYTGTWPMPSPPGGTYIGDSGGYGGAGGSCPQLGGTTTSPPTGFGSRSGGGGTGGYIGNGGAGGAGMPNSSASNTTRGSEGNGNNPVIGSGGGGGGSGDGSYLGSYSSQNTLINPTRSDAGAGVGTWGKLVDGVGGLASSYNTSTGALTSFGSAAVAGSKLGSSAGYPGYGGGPYYDISTLDTPNVLSGGNGAVRIVWPGNIRHFPATRTINEYDLLSIQVLIPSVTTNQGTAINVLPVIGRRGIPPFTYSISPTLPIGLSFNTSTATISGTTVVLMSSTIYTVTVRDSILQSISSTFTLNCNTALEGTYPTLVASTTIPTTIVKQDDIVSFKPVSAIGGLTPYIYSINTVLPSGLTINSSTGIVSGTSKDIVIDASYYVTVTDASLRTSTSVFSLTVAPVAELVILSSVGVPPVLAHNIGTLLDVIPLYGFDGLPPYTYSITPSLPYGLAFNTSTGKITGNASIAAASKEYTVKVIDTLSETVTASLFLTIVLQPLVATTTISTSTQNMGTSTNFKPVYASSSGGPPYNYSITPSLPSGLNISSTTGIISGTPTTYTSMITYTITIVDGVNQSGSSTFTMKVAYPILTTIANTAAVNGARGSPISVIPISGSGGVPPYTYSISPAIPSDMVFSTSNGTISGTPLNGFIITTMTVTVSDSVGQTSVNYFTLFVDFTAIPSQIAFTWPGTYLWTVPEGVTSISVVMVTPGGSPQTSNPSTTGYAGSGGGGLGYVNNIDVTPGQQVNIVIPEIDATFTPNVKSANTTVSWGTKGIIGTSGASGNGPYGGGAGGYVTFTQITTGVSYTGGVGGLKTGVVDGMSFAGGGGAAGYSGSGGAGGKSSRNASAGATAGVAGTGGGGGGGGGSSGTAYAAASGGGVGLFGLGANGAGGAFSIDSYPTGGGGGSGGQQGQYYGGGYFGGGQGGYGATSITNTGSSVSPNNCPIIFYGYTGGGAGVRIIWPGTTRQFPNTGTTDSNYTAPHIWSTSPSNPIIAFSNLKKDNSLVLAIPANSISDITGLFKSSTGGAFTDFSSATYRVVSGGVMFNGIKYQGYIHTGALAASMPTYTFQVTWLGINYGPSTLAQALANGAVYYGARVYLN